MELELPGAKRRAFRHMILMRSSMRMIAQLLVVASLAVCASPALAGPILDRIKSAGVVRCGGVERPGLLEIEPDGEAHGLELDLCRAMASVVLGSEGRLEFTNYDSEKAFAAARAGHEDVMFLTGREMIENSLAGQLIPGPTIFIETTSVLVHADSPYHHLSELADKPICFSIGGHAANQLQSWFDQQGHSFQRMGFQEDVEMNDAYAVNYCHGLAGETTTLADTVHTDKLATIEHRYLPETLAAYPILATTDVKDGEWAAIVAWGIDTLIRSDAPTSDWVRGGFESMPVDAPSLGLEKGWQKKLVALMGTYGQLFDRNLGAASKLHLERGVNGSVLDKGGFAPPYFD
jgi:general L-amino acid transport system substrate-binding protein